MLARRKKAAAIRDLDSIQDSTRVSFWGKYSSTPQTFEKTEKAFGASIAQRRRLSKKQRTTPGIIPAYSSRLVSLKLELDS